LHLVIREGRIDTDYIIQRTEYFDEVKRVAAAYWPERVEIITGVPQPDLVEAARVIGGARKVMILSARGTEQHASGVNHVLAYINLALALGKVGRLHSGFGTLTGQGNGQGGREHGQKADQLPGYRRIDDAAARRHVAEVWGVADADLPGPGKSAYEMLNAIAEPGGVRALLVMASNPVVSAPNAANVVERLKRLDFLVVSDFFLSETAQLADVVLPSAQWAEEDGTVTNLEGRVIRRRQVIAPPADVKNDIDLLCLLADRLGKRQYFTYQGAGDVFEELRRATRGGPADYSGITYDRLDASDGVFWPCADGEEGTPRLFTDRFPTTSGKARFHAVEHQGAAEEPDAEFPLLLTTGRVLAHYQSGTQTRRVRRLAEVCPEPMAEIHPQQASRHGLTDGDPVTLHTRRGSATFTTRVTPDIRVDTVFVPFHWPDERSANRLTNDALDPVSRMPEFKVCGVRISKT
jgi:assimilatory nitrate reductase catalytic subunit